MIAIGSNGFSPTDTNQQTILTQRIEKSISTYSNSVLMEKATPPSKELSTSNSFLQPAMPEYFLNNKFCRKDFFFLLFLTLIIGLPAVTKQ
jgi:hypothetical protein